MNAKRTMRITSMALLLLLSPVLPAQQPTTAPDIDPELSPETLPELPVEEPLSKRPPMQLSLDDLRTFTDVFDQIRSHYVESVSDETLLNAAIRGMLDELDPHSSFLTREQYARLNSSSRGRYGGVGVEVQIEDQQIIIISAMDHSPAAREGIQSGDVIESIDQQPVAGRDLRQAMNQLRGEPGSNVDLTIRRAGISIPLEFSLVREYIETPSVTERLLEGEYGYLRISKFQQNSDVQLKDALARLQAGSDGGLKGLVLDLRNNPGGVVNAAIGVADAFLEDGVITYTEGRDATANLKFSATHGDLLDGAPLVVLVNGGSASASEIVAGALKDHQRALLVGERTFGKGSVQSVTPMRNGSAVKLTTSRYYTPGGRSIQAAGIEPDFAVDRVQLAEPGQRVREADLEGHLDNLEGDSEASALAGQLTAEEDFALYQALNLLKGVRILSRSGESAENRG